VALKDLQQLQQAQEQARLQLRVAEARSQELEHQIDSLNQRLRESQEELTFFRKSRETKRPTRE
jgi:chromosome segregation ATPase